MSSKEVAKKGEVTTVAAGAVQGKLLVIRGHQVMLDQDLAVLYDIEPGALTRAVRRNKERFPDDFMFQLSKEEWGNLKRQSGISSSGHEKRIEELERKTDNKLAEHEKHLVAIFKVLKELASPPPKKKHPIGFAAAQSEEE